MAAVRFFDSVRCATCRGDHDQCLEYVALCPACKHDANWHTSSSAMTNENGSGYGGDRVRIESIVGCLCPDA